jgi:hypothetical protein
VRNWIAVNAVQQSILNEKDKNMTTLRLRKSSDQSLRRHGFLLLSLTLVLAWLALAPAARAVLPAPGGGYPGANTAVGTDALFSLTGGNDNTANGEQALYLNTNGRNNTATGAGALRFNTVGSANTANGENALNRNTTGNANTAIGYSALFLNTTGRLNIALGIFAGSNLATGDNNVAIGTRGVAAESNTIRIGRTIDFGGGNRAIRLPTLLVFMM